METLLNDIMTFLQLETTNDLIAISVVTIAIVSLIYLFKKVV